MSKSDSSAAAFSRAACNALEEYPTTTPIALDLHIRSGKIYIQQPNTANIPAKPKTTLNECHITDGILLKRNKFDPVG